MTIAGSNSRNDYVAVGLNCQFAYTFPITETAALDAYICGVQQSSGFTVSGAGTASGGTVTFTTSPGDGALVTLIRDESYTQGLDLVNQGPLDVDAIEIALDKGVMIDQQLLERFDRVPSFDVTSCVTSVRINDPTPNYFLRWSSSGMRIESAVGVCTSGTLTVPAFTAGSIVFAAGVDQLGQDNSCLFWNASSQRLGLGTSTPVAGLEFKLGCGRVTMINGAPTSMHAYVHPLLHGTCDSRGLAVETQSIATGDSQGARVSLYSGAQTGGGTGAGTGNRIWAGNFLVQANAADSDAQAIGIELNVNNNKTDSPNDLSGSTLKYGVSVVSDGNCKAAVAYGVSASSNAKWRRGVRVDSAAIADGGYAVDYRGDGQTHADGSSGPAGISADSCVFGDRVLSSRLGNSCTPYADAMYTQSGAKAWVVFDGSAANPITPSISFNIAGASCLSAPIVTKRGTGDYCVSFLRQFSGDRYTAVFTASATAGGSALIGGIAEQRGGCVRFLMMDASSTLTDRTIVTATFYGNQ
jgi:hypothetical protein